MLVSPRLSSPRLSKPSAAPSPGHDAIRESNAARSDPRPHPLEREVVRLRKELDRRNQVLVDKKADLAQAIVKEVRQVKKNLEDAARREFREKFAGFHASFEELRAENERLRAKLEAKRKGGSRGRERRRGEREDRERDREQRESSRRGRDEDRRNRSRATGRMEGGTPGAPGRDQEHWEEVNEEGGPRGSLPSPQRRGEGVLDEDPRLSRTPTVRRSARTGAGPNDQQEYKNSEDGDEDVPHIPHAYNSQDDRVREELLAENAALREEGAALREDHNHITNLLTRVEADRHELVAKLEAIKTEHALEVKALGEQYSAQCARQDAAAAAAEAQWTARALDIEKLRGEEQKLRTEEQKSQGRLLKEQEKKLRDKFQKETTQKIREAEEAVREKQEAVVARERAELAAERAELAAERAEREAEHQQLVEQLGETHRRLEEKEEESADLAAERAEREAEHQQLVEQLGETHRMLEAREEENADLAQSCEARVLQLEGLLEAARRGEGGAGGLLSEGGRTNRKRGGRNII